MFVRCNCSHQDIGLKQQHWNAPKRHPDGNLRPKDPCGPSPHLPSHHTLQALFFLSSCAMTKKVMSVIKVTKSFFGEAFFALDSTVAQSHGPGNVLQPCVMNVKTIYYTMYIYIQYIYIYISHYISISNSNL